MSLFSTVKRFWSLALFLLTTYTRQAIIILTIVRLEELEILWLQLKALKTKRMTSFIRNYLAVGILRNAPPPFIYYIIFNTSAGL